MERRGAAPSLFSSFFAEESEESLSGFLKSQDFLTICPISSFASSFTCVCGIDSSIAFVRIEESTTFLGKVSTSLISLFGTSHEMNASFRFWISLTLNIDENILENVQSFRLTRLASRFDVAQIIQELLNRDRRDRRLLQGIYDLPLDAPLFVLQKEYKTSSSSASVAIFSRGAKICTQPPHAYQHFDIVSGHLSLRGLRGPCEKNARECINNGRLAGCTRDEESSFGHGCFAMVTRNPACGLRASPPPPSTTRHKPVNVCCESPSLAYGSRDEWRERRLDKDREGLKEEIDVPPGRRVTGTFP